MNDVLALTLPIFSLIFIGYGTGRLVSIPDAGLVGLNFLVLYLALPALFFRLISQTPLNELGNWTFVLATTASTLLIFSVAFGMALLLSRGNWRESAIQGLAGSYGNIGYMGPGITLAAFGPAAVVPTALIFCFDNALMFTLAPLLIAPGGAPAGSAGQLAWQVIRRVLGHPFIMATILGVVAAAVEFIPPEPIDRLLTLLSNAAAPCALFAMGVAIATRPVKRIPAELPILILIKLILHPLITYVLLSWAGDFDPIWMYTAVVMASLPIATNVFVLAQQYGAWVNRASSAVLISTIVAIGTVTALLYLIRSGLLPADLFPV